MQTAVLAALLVALHIGLFVLAFRTTRIVRKWWRVRKLTQYGIVVFIKRNRDGEPKHAVVTNFLDNTFVLLETPETCDTPLLFRTFDLRFNACQGWEIRASNTLWEKTLKEWPSLDTQTRKLFSETFGVYLDDGGRPQAPWIRLEHALQAPIADAFRLFRAKCGP